MVVYNLQNLMLVATALIMVIVCQWILTYQSIVLKLDYHLNIQAIVALFNIYNNKHNNYGTIIGERYFRQIVHANNLLFNSTILLGLIVSIFYILNVSNSSTFITGDRKKYTDKININSGVKRFMFNIQYVYKLIIYSPESLFYGKL